MAAAQSFVLQQPPSLIKGTKTHFFYQTSSVNFKIFRTNSFRNLSLRKICSITQNNNISCSVKFNDDPVAYLITNHKNNRLVKIETTRKNPVEIAAEIVINALKKALQKPLVTAEVLGFLLLISGCPNFAWAASGGRAGGRSRSSSSRSSSRSSYSSSRSSSRSGRGDYVYSANSSSSDDLESAKVALLCMFTLLAVVLVCAVLNSRDDADATAVLKLQVGLLGSARSLQKDLNKIAETEDTSTSEGLYFILTETVQALLRYPEYCISAYSSIDMKSDREDGEKLFDQLSIEERGKFDEETLVNVDNVKKKSSIIPRPSGFTNEHIVVTILVAAGGKVKLPCISNNEDLKEALQRLASIPLSSIQAVEVLWTPQNEDDTLSKEEFLQDYPLLRSLQQV